MTCNYSIYRYCDLNYHCLGCDAINSTYLPAGESFSTECHCVDSPTLGHWGGPGCGYCRPGWVGLDCRTLTTITGIVVCLGRTWFAIEEYREYIFSGNFDVRFKPFKRLNLIYILTKHLPT